MSEAEMPYEVGSWNGMARFQCRFCPYDTRSEADAREHYRGHHEPAAPKAAQAAVRKVDRFGNPVEER